RFSALVDGTVRAPDRFGNHRVRRCASLMNLADTIGETRRDYHRGSLGCGFVQSLYEFEVGSRVEPRDVDAYLATAGEAGAPGGLGGDAEAQGLRFAGFDDFHAGGDDVGFDAASRHGALKLVDIGNRHLAARTDGRRAPGVDHRRDGDRTPGFEPGS